MDSRTWKWALISAPVMLSVSACVGWGGYPPAKNVHNSQLIGTWSGRKCGTTVTLNPDGSASATGIPAEMELDLKVTQEISGDGTWKVNEFGGEQQLDVITGNEVTTFGPYRDKGHLLVALTVGDPDTMNWCILTRHSKTAANAPTAVQQ
ncbi:hypothetical protein ACFRNJ_19640 [Streptomyces sp. NPDC056721]|uniref:hypothetical protein n=1 Tax=Streptomyces sp. NPDC056721 TaxID=3345923 RepID=UPI003697D586